MRKMWNPIAEHGWGLVVAIPKPNSSEVRLIHDCSRPHGHAVNDFSGTWYFKFQSLDDAIKLLKT